MQRILGIVRSFGCSFAWLFTHGTHHATPLTTDCYGNFSLATPSKGPKQRTPRKYAWGVRETQKSLARFDSKRSGLSRQTAPTSRQQCCETRATPSIPMPVPQQMPRKRRKETISLPHRDVMRLARVIIKLKSRQNRVEFLAADNVTLSFLRHEQSISVDMTSINRALTNRCRWLTIQ